MNHPQTRTTAFFVLTAALLLCTGTKSNAEVPLEAAVLMQVIRLTGKRSSPA